MVLKSTEANAKKRLEDMAKSASGGKKAAVDAKYGGANTSEQAARQRLSQLAEQSVREQTQLSGQDHVARISPVSMRPETETGVGQTNRFDADVLARSMGQKHPREKTADELRREQQAAEWDQYAAESRAQRIQNIMEKTPQTVWTESNVEAYKPYAYWSDQLTGEMLESSRKSAEAAALSDAVWNKTQANLLASSAGKALQLESMEGDLEGKDDLYRFAYLASLADRSGWTEEQLRDVTDYVTQQANANRQAERSETAKSVLGKVSGTVSALAGAALPNIVGGAGAETNKKIADTVGDLAAGALTVPGNLVGGVMGYADAAAQGAAKKITGSNRPIDWNTGYMALANTSNDVREQLAANVAERFPQEILGTNVASFLYQTGMSMADSGAILGLSLLGVPAASSLLSGSAAFSAAKEAKERGGTDSQALGYGLAAGIAEGLFETVSLEKLTENLVGGLSREAARATGGRKILKILESAGIQGLTEGSEEVFTTLANTVSDAIIMGDRSDYNTTVRQYMEQGMSEDEARRQAGVEWLTGLLGDAIGGFLSGGIMAGAGTAISSSIQSRETTQDILRRVAMESVQEQISAENRNASLPAGTVSTNAETQSRTEAAQARQELSQRVQESAAEARQAVAREGNPGYNGTTQNNTEVQNLGRDETVYLRRGGERADSQNPGRSVSGVEEGAGGNQIREAENRPADGEASRLTYDKARLSTRALGVENGSTTGTLYRVTGGETTATRAAKQLAEENGAKLVLFGGGNLRVKNSNGVYCEARGMYDGKTNTIYVRADHAQYTAEQLTRHEMGHKWIADGEVNVDAVRERVGQDFTPEQVESMAGMYLDAYADTGLSEAEVWEEVVCDALGAMNLFRGFSEESDAAVLLGSASRAAREMRSQARAEQSRSGEAGQKLSREVDAEKRFRRSFSGRVVSDESLRVADSEKSEVSHALKTGYGKFDPDGRSGSVNTARYCYLFDVTDDGVRITDAIDHDALNIHSGEFAKEYNHGEQRNYSRVGTQSENRGSRSGHRAQRVSATSEAGESRANDHVDRAKSGSDSRENLREIKGTGEREVKLSLNGKNRVDAGSAQAYNGTGRSPALNDALAKLNAGEHVDVQTILQAPEITYAEQANEGTPTIELPGREGIRQAAYEKAMQRGSWDGKGFNGPVRQERRMDIVLGLPGSGKSSVYTEPLSQEHGSRVIDTDDYRADIPEYNGRNAPVVHEEASRLKKRVLADSLETGDNILLSIIGDNAEKLERDIQTYNDYGYSVYLHLNELPNNKAMARAINRYVNEDGTLGRYVSPKLIAEYGDKPTQTYLSLTGQGGQYGKNLDRSVSGGSRTGGQRGRGISESTLSGVQSQTASLAGWDWYNNDVAYGEAPRLIQSSENGASAGEANAKFSQELDLDKLREENERLKARVERLKGETKITREKTVRQEDVNKLARRIVKDYDSTLRADEISGALKEIGDSIVRGGEHMTYEALMDRIRPIANEIVENASVLNDEMYQEYKGLRDYLRKTRMTLGAENRNDLSGYESYNEFRKRYMGKILLTNDGTPVDVVYQELASMYPELFSEDVLNPGDQLGRIADVLDSLAPVYENPYGFALEAASNEVANEILDSLIGEDVRQTAPTYADRQAKRLQETRARYQRELARVRQNRDEQIRKLKEHQKTVKSAESERRNASALRKKIMKHTSELSRRLLRPTDAKHIPEALRSAVASVLESVNLESERAPKRTEQFLKLKEAYQTISGETVVDPSLLGIDGESGLLDRVAEMGDKPISSMNSEELTTLWQTVRAVEASVQNANRTLTEGKFKATSEWAQRLRTDTATRKNKRGNRAAIDLEDPYTFFSHYGESGKAVYRMLRNAQDDARVKLDQIIEAVGDIVDPKTVKNAQRTRHEFTLASGEKLTLTTGQIMGLYNLSQRQQAQNHLLKGGIVQPEIKRSGKQAKIERGTRLIALTEGDLASFFSALSAEEMNIARPLQNITATTLAQWGNEASMKAYGYRKFTGADYWPIHSAGETLLSSTDRSSGNARSIANIGLAKSVIPGASNAIDVYDVFDDFAQHTADMIDYAAWLLPMEDANRLFNYRYKDETGRTIGTVKGILDENGGKGAQQYWSKLMEDIQNGIRSETDATSSLANKMVGNVKAAAVGANLRVVAQQPTAYVRAAAVLDPVNMAKGLVKGATKGNGWAKAKKYAPIARIKDAGSFDQSNLRSISSELYDSGTWRDKLSDKTGVAAGAADAVTWGKIWNACEWQVFRENRNIGPGSDAFYKKTAELFTEVIDQTQVVDGILQRSQVMRSGNAITKQATSFMGEPIKSLNVLLRSWDQFRYENNVEKKKAAAKTFVRAAAALTATDLVNAAVQSFIDAIRDDDKDKKYWERWISALTGIEGDEESMAELVKNILAGGNAADNMNPLGRIPYVSDVWSLLQGYSVDRMDMSAVSDFIDAATTFAKNIGGDGRYTQAYAAKQLLATASKAFGISLPNLTRDAWGIARTAVVETGDIWAQYQMEKAIYNISSESNKSRYMSILYQALETGDTELYLKIAAELIGDDGNGITGKSVESAMKSRYEKERKENPAYHLPAGMAELVRIVPTYQEDKEDETYDVSNLSAAAYQSYLEQRASGYEKATEDVVKSTYFKSLDEAGQAKVYGYIDKLTHSYALADASGGDYTITTNWIEDFAGAKAKGISTAQYALFHMAYVSLESDKTSDGKTIKGRAKSDKVEKWLQSQNLTKSQKQFLWETVYSEKTNPF